MSHNKKYDYDGHKYWFIVMNCVFIYFDLIHESIFDSQIRAFTGIKWSLGFESVIRDWLIEGLLILLELNSNDLSEYLRKCFHFNLYYSIDFNNI